MRRSTHMLHNPFVDGQRSFFLRPHTDKAIKPPAQNKGQMNGECYRGVCRNPNATWFNSSTQKYYCGPCSAMIMKWPENRGLLTNQAFAK